MCKLARCSVLARMLMLFWSAECAQGEASIPKGGRTRAGHTQMSVYITWRNKFAGPSFFAPGDVQIGSPAP